jgi:aspartyl-tRNA(Asn)/glutamyl-tRNA(Gln) amidotransferase subunit A
MSQDFCYLSAHELIAGYRRGAFSPLEVTRAILDRIDKYNPVLNCFCHLDRETTLGAAQDSEARWRRGKPLGLVDGVPVSIKDLLPLRGWPTTMGSLSVDPEDFKDEEDPSVARLREQGAIFLGKTNTPEFGNSGVTNSPRNGLTVNPWDVTKTTGGSSGGSAAAVAAGLGPVSIGTDAGGSIRTPSSFCGLVGLKTTFGRVPQFRGGDWGGISVSGPIARTAADAALAMSVLSRPDNSDWNALPPENRDYVAELDGGVKGLRIAFSLDLGFMPVNSEVAEIVTKAFKIFADLGADLVEATPSLGDPVPLFDIFWTPNFVRLAENMTPEQCELLDQETKDAIERGGKISLLKYMEAQNQRAELAREMRRFHETYDLLITPTAIVLPYENAHLMPPEWDTSRSWLWELPPFCFNLTRQPAITVPCGFSEAGLPIGLQIVAPIYEDSRALRAAHAFQMAYSTTDRRPPLD